MSDVAKAFVEMLRKSSDLPDHVRQGILGVGADAVPPLLELLAERSLDDPDNASGGKARLHASVLLGYLDDRRAVEPLLDALVADRGAPKLVRAHAASLTRLGDVAAPTLARAKAADSDADRMLLAMVLASCGERSDEVAAFLRELLPTDPMLVLPLVGRYGDPALATDVAKVLLTSGLDGPLTARAIQTLAELGVTHPKLDDLSDKAWEKARFDELSTLVSEAQKLLRDVLPEH